MNLSLTDKQADELAYIWEKSLCDYIGSDDYKSGKFREGEGSRRAIRLVLEAALADPETCEVCRGPRHELPWDCNGTASVKSDDHAVANDVLAEVGHERERQESLRLAGKFRATCATTGEHEMSDPECLAVLAEEFGEAARAVSEGIAGNSELGRTHLREELIQVAAVAVAWAERIS
jgi:hypothetical protein